MKIRTLSCLAGISAPLILAGSANAGFVGISVVKKAGAEQFGLTTINIYAIFDRPGEDIMQAVAGTPGQTLTIEAVGGTFWQDPLGTNKAPTQAFVNIFPSLAYDSFVTIGVKTSGAGGSGGVNVPDQLTLTPTFPGDISGSVFQLTNDSWAVTPANAQSNPFDPTYANGDGTVLIGQFSSADTDTFSGTMKLQYVSNGVVVQSVESFFHVPAPGALALLGTAGLIGARRRRR